MRGRQKIGWIMIIALFVAIPAYFIIKDPFYGSLAVGTIAYIALATRLAM